MINVRGGIKLCVNVGPALKEAKTAIFFIHGVAGSSKVWSSQLEYFSEKGYRVVAPDLIGHGFSEAPDESYYYRFISIAHDCLTVFDRFSSSINYVIGHSYGTAFAAYLAHHRSSKIEKIVFMSGGAPVPLAPQGGVFSLPTLLLTCLKPALVRTFYRKAFHKKNMGISNKGAAFDVPLYVLRHVMSGQIWYDGDEEFHRNLKQSVLLLHGNADQFEEVEDTMDMHSVIKNSELHILPEAGHMVMMEKPFAVNELLSQFFSKSADVIKEFEQSKSPTLSHHRDHSHQTKSIPNLRVFK